MLALLRLGDPQGVTEPRVTIAYRDLPEAQMFSLRPHYAYSLPFYSADTNTQSQLLE